MWYILRCTDGTSVFLQYVHFKYNTFPFVQHATIISAIELFRFLILLSTSSSSLSSEAIRE